MKRLFLALCLSALAMTGFGQAGPKREFRGAWIQCINGQFQGLGRDAMQANLTRQLDALQRCGINAIIFQVRAEADALYASDIEPWSRYLTGRQGEAPSPMWDPLQWMVEQCHARGMELHAWINPYRAKTAGTTELAANHPSVLHPERFFNYGNLVLFNPGLAENRQHICTIVADIVSRYDIDGFHMDDYFYPYPQAGVAIPDQQTFAADPRGFGNIADWRRDNVTLLVRDIHYTIQQLKPWVKFGISPFGIYHNARSGNQVPGSETGGLQNYDDLYADVLAWAKQGIIDYCMPQLYWEIGHKTADHETLVKWWARNVGPYRPIIVGQDVTRTVKAPDLKNPAIHQLPAKMALQRGTPGVCGSCLWYSAAVTQNIGNVADAYAQIYHRTPALQPLFPFIDNRKPAKVKGLKAIWTDNGYVLVWLPPTAKTVMDEPRNYVVYRFRKGERIDLNNPEKILCITPQTYLQLPYEDGSTRYTYAVTVLDRMQNESSARKAKVAL